MIMILIHTRTSAYTELDTANSDVSTKPKYKELFGEILEQKIYISRILNEKFSFRKKLIKNEEN